MMELQKCYGDFPSHSSDKTSVILISRKFNSSFHNAPDWNQQFSQISINVPPQPNAPILVISYKQKKTIFKFKD